MPVHVIQLIPDEGMPSSRQLSETSHCRSPFWKATGFISRRELLTTAHSSAASLPLGQKAVSLQATSATAQKHFNIRNPVLLPGIAFLTEQLLGSAQGPWTCQKLLHPFASNCTGWGCAGPTALSYRHKARAARAPPSLRYFQTFRQSRDEGLVCGVCSRSPAPHITL